MRHVLRITFPDSLRVRVVPQPEPAAPPRQGRTIHREGGKPAAPALIKQVKLGTVRQRVLDYCAGGVVIADACAHFKISRANLVMHFVALHREHGVGYQITGGRLTPLYPKG